MKKVSVLLIIVTLLLSYSTGCNRNITPTGRPTITKLPTAAITPTSTSTPILVPTITKMPTVMISPSLITTVESLYQDLYIGESFESGFVYLEPFNLNRPSGGLEFKFKQHPESLVFYSLENAEEIYNIRYDSDYFKYIPSIEIDSDYYWQGFNEDEQNTLRYKISGSKSKRIVGIAFLNNKIKDIDFSYKGKKRTYSKSEYNDALEYVKKQLAEISDFGGGVLRDITINDTIVGAEMICTISFNETDIKILLSKYMSIGMESVANAYVLDFIDGDGKIIKTYEKWNGVSY